MMTITPEIVVAYSRCPREAYFLLCTKKKGSLHPYTQHISKQRTSNRSQYLSQLRQSNPNVLKYQDAELKTPDCILTNAVFKTENLKAFCDILINPSKGRQSKHNCHEPILVSGKRLVGEDQKIELGYASYVLGKAVGVRPSSGKIISLGGKSHRINLAPIYRKLNPIIAALKEWSQETSKVPPPVLNRNCPSCRFRDGCRTDALALDHLSLIGGMNPREIERQNSRGIFTINQLSFTYRPRKQRKDQENRIPKFHHSLKALALREKQTYVVSRPKQPESKTQIFLDIEGLPDRGSYYLIGLLFREKDSYKKVNLWADSEDDEEKIWSEFQRVVEQYDDIVIYHYGDYDARALKHLTRKFGAGSATVAAVSSKLINVLSLIYGSIYFPTYGNGLKEIASFLGATWSQESASGLCPASTILSRQRQLEFPVDYVVKVAV